MHPNDAEGIANSVDPDQTAGLALFAQACLSKNLGSLRYPLIFPPSWQWNQTINPTQKLIDRFDCLVRMT